MRWLWNPCECIKTLWRWSADRIGRANTFWQRVREDLWPLGVALLAAFGGVGLSFYADTPQEITPALLGRLGIALPSAFSIWAVGYLSMLSSERRRADAAEKALAEARQEAREANRRADEFFPEMMKLLRQIAANTAPGQPSQPGQSAPGDENHTP